MGTETLTFTELERFRFPLKILRFWSISFTIQALTLRLSNKPQAMDNPRYSNNIAPGSMVFVPGAIRKRMKSKQWRFQNFKAFSTNNSFSLFYFTPCSLKNVLDVRLNEQTFSLHTNVSLWLSKRKLSIQLHRRLCPWTNAFFLPDVRTLLSLTRYWDTEWSCDS